MIIKQWLRHFGGCGRPSGFRLNKCSEKSSVSSVGARRSMMDDRTIDLAIGCSGSLRPDLRCRLLKIPDIAASDQSADAVLPVVRAAGGVQLVLGFNDSPILGRFEAGKHGTGGMGGSFEVSGWRLASLAASMIFGLICGSMGALDRIDPIFPNDGTVADAADPLSFDAISSKRSNTDTEEPMRKSGLVRHGPGTAESQ